MEIRHVMYRASLIQNESDILRIYGNGPLERTIELEKILGMNMCYSVFNGNDIISFCFIGTNKRVYLFKRQGMYENYLLNFPSIFDGEFVVKNEIPKQRIWEKSHFIYLMNHLISQHILEMGLGGNLNGPGERIEIPKFSTLNELKMKMEISRICQETA
jgi:hypothetical protein